MSLYKLHITKTDGSTEEFNPVVNTNDVLPSQSGESGKFLTTSGTGASWGAVEMESGSTNGTVHLKLNNVAQSDVSVTGLGSLAYKSNLVAGDIPDLDATKIASGKLDIDRIPATALNKVAVVATEEEKLTLTIADVQTGDTVKVTATKKMYMVKDDTVLGTEAAFEEYLTSTDWSTVTNKPTTIEGYGITDAKIDGTTSTNITLGGVSTTISQIGYGVCETAAATAAKTVTISNNPNWKLEVGSIVFYKSTYSNTAGSATLNVNDTGAKPLYYNTSAYIGPHSQFFYANRITYVMYDGTYWVWLGCSAEENTTYTPQALGFGYGTCSTAASTTAKEVTLASYNLVTNGIVSVKFTYGVPASATMNINSKGAKAIYYKGSAITDNVIGAGDVATFIYNGSQYVLLSKDAVLPHNHDDRYYISGGVITLGDNSITPVTDISGKQDTISDLATIRSGAAAGATAVQPAAISDMATKTWTGQQGYLTSASTLDATKLSGTASVDTTGNASTATTATDYASSGGIATALAGKASTDVATTSANGLMSSADKTKLDGLNNVAMSQTTEVISSAASTPQSFTLGSFAAVQVYMNGVLCTEGASDQYTVSGTTVTFNDILPVGTEVKFVTYSAVTVGAVPGIATATSVGSVKPGNGMSVDSYGALTVQEAGNAITATTATNYASSGGIATALAGKLPLSGGTLTGGISLNGVPYVPVPNTADAHNAIFRGRDLTSVYSVEQLASKVANSDFSDLFIGDFITKSVTVNGNTTTQNWRFAGFNWFHASYYVSTPHIVMVPDGCLVVNVNMNDTNTTVGGYFGSRMHTQTIPQVDSALETAFGSSHVLTHKRLLTTAINGSTPTGNGMGWSGASSSTDWKDVKSCLMSETMVYGHHVYSSSAMDNVDCMGRFPLFNHARRFSVNTGAVFWLSCVASSTSFCIAASNGNAHYAGAGYSDAWLGVRPYFLFK